MSNEGLQRSDVKAAGWPSPPWLGRGRQRKSREIREDFLEEVEFKFKLGSRSHTGFPPTSVLHLNLPSNNLNFADVPGRVT